MVLWLEFRVVPLIPAASGTRSACNSSIQQRTCQMQVLKSERGCVKFIPGSAVEEGICFSLLPRGAA